MLRAVLEGLRSHQLCQLTYIPIYAQPVPSTFSHRYRYTDLDTDTDKHTDTDTDTDLMSVVV
jgi:hypothetical protein